jgi:hypothetical protein
MASSTTKGLPPMSGLSGSAVVKLAHDDRWGNQMANDGKRNASDDDGINDEVESPVADVTAGSRQLADRLEQHHGADQTLSGGDIDARWEDAESGGDETVGGSTATPEQNDVEAIGRALGVTYADDETLDPGEKEAARDAHRWELDPASSEDYAERSSTPDPDEDATLDLDSEP